MAGIFFTDNPSHPATLDYEILQMAFTNSCSNREYFVLDCSCIRPHWHVSGSERVEKIDAALSQRILDHSDVCSVHCGIALYTSGEGSNALFRCRGTCGFIPEIIACPEFILTPSNVKLQCVAATCPPAIIQRVPVLLKLVRCSRITSCASCTVSTAAL